MLKHLSTCYALLATQTNSTLKGKKINIHCRCACKIRSSSRCHAKMLRSHVQHVINISTLFKLISSLRLQGCKGEAETPLLLGRFTSLNGCFSFYYQINVANDFNFEQIDYFMTLFIYLFFHTFLSSCRNACFIACMCAFRRMKQLARAREAPWDAHSAGTLAAMGTKCFQWKLPCTASLLRKPPCLTAVSKSSGDGALLQKPDTPQKKIH